jgi:hypothetical protein
MRIIMLENPFRWPVSPLILLLAAALPMMPATLHGAAITWGPATDISGDGDVINTGTLAYAYDFYAPSTVNGVGFTALGAVVGTNVFAPGFFDSGPYFTSSSNPFAALSTAYKNVLTGGVYIAGSSPVPVPVTLSNLVIGRKYSVQVWVNDPRGPENNRTETITSAGGNTNTLKFSTNTLSNPGGPGQYTVGTFTADANSQTFSLTGNPGDNVTQMNALQVRDISTQGQPVWISINPAGAGAVKLVFTGPSGAFYTLLTTTNITTPAVDWTPLPGGAGTFAGISINYIDSAATNKNKFYGIRSP